MREMTDAEVFGPAARPPQVGAPRVPRGIRNNNPGNIEDGPFARSQPGYKGSDGRFAIYDTPEAGTAAKTALLGSYGRKGINTVEGVVNRWAPPSENDSGSYAQFVSQKLGVDPRAPLDMTDPRVLSGLSSAIAQRENGVAAAPSMPMPGVEMSEAEVFGKPKPPPLPGQPGAVPIPQMGPGVTMERVAPYEGMKSEALGFKTGIANVAANLAPFSPANLIPGFRDANAAAGERLKASLERQAQQREPGKIGRFAGDIVSTAWMPGGPLVSGGLTGAALSEKENLGGVALDTLAGALGSKAGASVIGGLGRTIAGVTDAGVRRLADKGVPLTLGQMAGEGLGGKMVRGIEDRVSGLPVVGDIVNAARGRSVEGGVRAAYNDTLKQIGQKLPDGMHLGEEAFNHTKQALTDAYDAVLEPLVVRQDPAYRTAIATVKTEIAKIGDPAIRKSALDILKTELDSRFGAGGVMNGESMKAVQEALRGHVDDLYKGTKWSRDAAKALGGAKAAIEGLVDRTDAAAGTALKAVNRGYSMFKPIEKAAAAANRTEGVFNPQQFLVGVTQGKSKSAIAGGKVPQQQLARDMGRILPNRVPDSGTAGRMVIPGFAALGAGGALTANPLMVGGATLGGLLSTLYTRGGQKALTATLTRRPEVARVVGQNVRRLGAPVGASVGAVLPSAAVSRENKKRP